MLIAAVTPVAVAVKVQQNYTFYHITFSKFLIIIFGVGIESYNIAMMENVAFEKISIY